MTAPLPRTIAVIMGVSGSGKSTIGKLAATRLGWTFEDGDDLHSSGNVAKMRAGIPLNDADRGPWLTAVAVWIDAMRIAGRPGIIACSALKRAYRKFLADGRSEVVFVYLKTPPAVLERRLAARSGHFMPASLLNSQLTTLEEPTTDENALIVDGDRPSDALITEICQAIVGF